MDFRSIPRAVLLISTLRTLLVFVVTFIKIHVHMLWDLWSFPSWIMVILLFVLYHLLALIACRSSIIVLHIWFSVSMDGPALLLHLVNFIPVQQRINFKILLHVYNCMNSLGPSYLSGDIFLLSLCVWAGFIFSKDTIYQSCCSYQQSCNRQYSFLSQRPTLNDLPIFICMPLCMACSVQSFKKRCWKYTCSQHSELLLLYIWCHWFLSFIGPVIQPLLFLI